MGPTVIGKRISVGAALTSTALVLGKIWPEHLEVFVAASVPLTFVIQIIIVKFFGVTTSKPK